VRIAFYAPLKPPNHPVPSGDRLIARMLIRALELAGHRVALASRLRSWDRSGDTVRQARIQRIGGRLARQRIARYRSNPESCPDLWLTYHVYHKAPDWIGPFVADTLAIPYVVVEASIAPKQENSPWAAGHAAARAAIARADAIIGLNGDDRAGLLASGIDPARIFALAPFIDTSPYAHAARCRETLAACYGVTPNKPWLLSVAMMRRGAKFDSYQVLAKAMARLDDLDWQLLIAGDGPARGEVEALFRTMPHDRVFFLGMADTEKLPNLYASADIYLWPAIHEAFGIGFLEAQAAGLPVVAGRERGVPEIVRDGETGILTPPGEPAAFATAVRDLLREVARRHAMGRRAREIVFATHDITVAAKRLNDILGRAIAEHGR